MPITTAAMVRSAASALLLTLDAFGDGRLPQTVLSFDCISRKRFLGVRDNEEMRALNSAGVDLVGALTAGGEFGTGGKDFLDDHNRTCVVGVFEE